VLYPGTRHPLHIFEPRYRQMVARCLEGDRKFGLIYHDPDRSGPFDLEPGRVGCVAEIIEFHPLPDGRSLLLIQGKERGRLADGIESDALYYEGLVEEYEDAPEEGAELDERKRETREHFDRVYQKLNVEKLPPIDDEMPLSYQLARWIQIDPAWQQDLLESRSEMERLDRIDVLLKDALEEMK